MVSPELQLIFLIILFILGAAFGSFACCQARRLRRAELGKEKLGKWSVCEHCGKRLKWQENIPLISWTVQHGRCKNCHTKIGITEFLAELGTALVFLAIGLRFFPNILFSPLEIAKLVVLLLFVTSLVVCFIYDALWQLLPLKVLWLSVALAAVYFVLNLEGAPNWLDLALSLGILPGVYFLLYFFSKEKLVGSGDWILALAIALVLAHPWSCLVALFLSNFLAILVMLPVELMKLKKKALRAQIPFGPFLILAFLIVYLASEFLIQIGVII